MRSIRVFLAPALVLVVMACANQASSQAPVVLETEDQKTLYALGLAIAQNLGQFNLTESELAFVQAGIVDGVTKKEARVDLQTYGPKLSSMAQARAQAVMEVEKKAAEAFLAQKAAESGAVKTESGLIYKEITAGTGDNPKPTDAVTVHYTGTLRDGKKFDSSVDRGQPATFRLNGVIPCWTEGVQKMKVGGKAQLVCPAAIAYGDRGAPPNIPGGASLVFEVELIKVEPAPAPPPAPTEQPQNQ